jgi:hypothetical protein
MTGETEIQAEVAVPGAALLARLARNIRIDCHALAAAKTRLDRTARLVAKDQRAGQDGITDLRLGVPVKIGAAYSHRGHANELFVRAGNGRIFVHQA